jgi:hypothetical protein
MRARSKDFPRRNVLVLVAEVHLDARVHVFAGRVLSFRKRTTQKTSFTSVFRLQLVSTPVLPRPKFPKLIISERTCIWFNEHISQLLFREHTTICLSVAVERSKRVTISSGRCGLRRPDQNNLQGRTTHNSACRAYQTSRSSRGHLKSWQQSLQDT